MSLHKKNIIIPQQDKQRIWWKHKNIKLCFVWDVETLRQSGWRFTAGFSYRCSGLDRLFVMLNDLFWRTYFYKFLQMLTFNLKKWSFVTLFIINSSYWCTRYSPEENVYTKTNCLRGVVYEWKRQKYVKTKIVQIFFYLILITCMLWKTWYGVDWL